MSKFRESFKQWCIDNNSPLLSEWDYSKNSSIDIETVTSGSNLRVWWKCSFGHEWEATIDKRCLSGRGCPYCTGKKILPGYNDLKTTHPTVASCWHPTKNGQESPEQFSYGSQKIVWWKGDCGHEWDRRIREQVQNNTCLFCSGKRVLIGFNDIASQFPQLVPEWDLGKNNGLLPTQFTKGSGQSIWWKCSKGHSWNTKISSRVYGDSGCPYCSRKKILAGYNDFPTLYPDIAKELHPTKNQGITFEGVSSSSSIVVWWLGKCGHEWEMPIHSRTNNKSGCPYCSSTRVLEGFNDLQTKNPEIAAEWHPTKNGDLLPTQVMPASDKRVWWLGKCGHEWEVAIDNRAIGGNGCPYCRNFFALKGYNDLETKYPDLTKQWHPIKNSQRPDEVTFGYTKKVWWIGPCGHEWEDTVYNRSIREAGCPYCRGRLLKGFNDLESNYPELVKEWHPSKNGDLTPSEISKNSQRKIWWIGPCGHEFFTNVYQRTKNKRGCPYCSTRILPGFNDLSIKNPELAKQWHPTKNDPLKPSDVGPGDNRKVWWIGPCGHEFEAPVNNRNRGSSCPYCTNTRVLPGFNDFKSRYPELAKEWDYEKNEKIDPTHIMPSCSETVWWKCENGHKWEATVYSRAIVGTTCSICDRRTLLTGENDFQTLYPNIAKEWHPIKNTPLLPSEILPSHNELVWWLGECGHEWQQTPTYRKNHRTGCPICYAESRTSFNEQALYFFIKQVFPNALSEYRPDFMEGKELDIFIPELRLAIEYDGEFFHKDTKRDKHKAELCKLNDVDLVRVREPGLPELHESITCINVSSPGDEAVIETLAYLEEHIYSNYDQEVHFQNNIDENSLLILQQMLSSRKERSIETLLPNLAKLWHPTKNGMLKPDMVGIYTPKKFWWMGPCGHEWTAAPSGLQDNTECPYCSGRRVLKGFNDLETLKPEIAKQWHPTLNGDLKPSEVTIGSNRKVWWLGPCGHEWERAIGGRVSTNSSCPYCLNQKFKEGINDLATANPELAKEWHPTLNGYLQPWEVITGSHMDVWWMCEKGHEWHTKIVSRTSTKTGCPFCNKAAINSKGSFEEAYPDLVKQWHPTKNGSLTPKSVSAGSNIQIWWICELGHEWQANPHNRGKGRGCPYCYNKRVWKGFNDLETKFPDVAKEWDYSKNNGVLPSEILSTSKKKYWWKCKEGHEWETLVSTRTRLNCGCPVCYKNRRYGAKSGGTRSDKIRLSKSKS